MPLIVFGSINMDLVVRTPRLPTPSETVTGYEFFTAPGGKGANQAVAAARLGIETYMVGRVGDDNFGTELVHHLQSSDVNIEAIRQEPDISSGIAQISIDDQGDNHIIIVPGANGHMDASDAMRLNPYLAEADLLLLQLEIPMIANLAAAQLARKHGVKVILDPAPAQLLPEELYAQIAVITPNQLEASQMTGFQINSIEDALHAATELVRRNVGAAIITMAEQGVSYVTKNGEKGHIPAFAVQAADTVGAGDAFNGAVAAALIHGLSLPEAIRHGAAAGAWSVARRGAQASMPTPEQIQKILN